jgi:hypothetical protein
MSSPEAPPEIGATNPHEPPPEIGYGDDGDLLADVAMENAKLRDLATRILAQEEGAEMSNEMIQEGLAALTRLYTVKFQEGERWSPFSENQMMPATSIMIMTTSMCRAVNVELFELGMWQAWSGA